MSNGAAPLSEGVRAEIRRGAARPLHPRLLRRLGVRSDRRPGSTTGPRAPLGAPKFGVGADVEVFDEDMKPCPPGVDGMLGRTGPIPLGYYKDPVKTAATFKEVDGVRWSIPGDFARREEDGSVTVLGRGSVCINTGGEKVHPEEVEAVLLRHDDVVRRRRRRHPARALGPAGHRAGPAPRRLRGHRGRPRATSPAA